MTITGKQFEERFKKDWGNSFPNSFIIRLPDQMSGYKNSNNICDFLCFNNRTLWLMECKAHKGASIPLGNITQYELLELNSHYENIVAGVVLFLYEKDKVFFIPVSTITKLKQDGKKSVGLKSVEEGYEIYELPSKKLRVFMETDYTFLLNLI